MANASSSTKLALWIFLLITIHGNALSLPFVEVILHRGTLKTLQIEDGDAIDCVDIYQQPAFDHPLLKNHTIQMKPSSYPSGIKVDDSQAKLFQPWHGHGKCPEGTIPIFYAQVSVSGLNFHGLKAGINVWNPYTNDQEYSLARVSVIANTDIIEAGWMVNRRRYKDTKTRLFLHWTHQRLGRTRGCYDLDCPGFVQTCSDFIIGSPIKPVSEYGTNQFYITITIYKDIQSGNWWVKLQDKDLGYWPSSIITSSSATLTTLTWGGEILNSNLGGHHTATKMGSGRFPGDKFGKSIQKDTKSKFGTYFFYGGPGRSDKCP
ncbi:hypothetical protein AAG906_041046 [Vitis piasezkii]